MSSGVYIIQDSRGRVKIGYSKNVRGRLLSIGGAIGEEVALLRVIPGTKVTERWLHRKFSQYRIKGEWFHFTAGMLTIVTPDELPPRRKPVHKPGTSADFLAAAEFLGLMDNEALRPTLLHWASKS